MKFSETLLKAEAAIGTTEYPPGTNRTPFAPLVDQSWPIGFSRQGSQWCGTWVEWLLGRDMLHGIGVFSVPFGVQKFRQAGLWSSAPQPGYVCFMSFSPDRFPGHVGWVKDVVSSNIVVTIEGNTQINVQGLQSNGGGVYMRTRMGSSILGYGRVDYDPEHPEGEPVPYLLVKSKAYRNVYALFPGGMIRPLSGLREFAKLVAAGVELDDNADLEEITKLHKLSGDTGQLDPI